MCGHWKFSFLISLVSQWYGQDFLKFLGQKRKQQIFLVFSCWLLTRHSFNANWGHIQLCLNLHFWSCRPQRSARCASLKSFHVFFEHASVPKHMLCTPHSLVYVVAYKVTFLHESSLSDSYFSGFQSVWCLLIFNIFPQVSRVTVCL